MIEYIPRFQNINKIKENEMKAADANPPKNLSIILKRDTGINF